MITYDKKRTPYDLENRKKEFLLNLTTFKFSPGTLFCIVLLAVFVPIRADDYQQRLAAQTNELLAIQTGLVQ